MLQKSVKSKTVAEIATETGQSNLHQLVVTMMKSGIPKHKPKIAHFRNYKYFNRQVYKEEIKNFRKAQNTEKLHVETFQRNSLNTLDDYAPTRTKYLRAKLRAKFVTKDLRKSIMLRSKFWNHYIKQRTDASLICYKKQRNIRVFMIKKKSKKDYYEKLIDLSDMMDSKNFWNKVKPGFHKKLKAINVTLVKNCKLITSEKQLAEIFNFLENIL